MEDFAKTAATCTASEHAQRAESLMQQVRRAESLMQQVRKLGHLPRESQSQPQEQKLARQLRDATANGLLVAFEEELRQIAAADAKAMSMRLATEQVLRPLPNTIRK